jgi:hypothetical protein
MEKLQKTLLRRYATSVIYTDDLLKIIEILSVVENSYEIMTEDYKFQDFLEFEKKYSGQKIKYLKIKAYKPYITIDFTKYGIELYCGADDQISSGLFYKIDLILGNTRRKFNFLYLYPSFLVVLFFVESIDLNLYGIIPKYILILINSLFLFLYIWVGYIRLFKSSYIRIVYRTEVKKFFDKYKEFFSGLLIGLIILVLEHIFQIINFINDLIYKK